MSEQAPLSEVFATPLATMNRISRACHRIESEMGERLPGAFRATYQPRGDSFLVRWELGDGRKAEIDVYRQQIETGSAPFGYLSVFLRHRVSLQEVR